MLLLYCIGEGGEKRQQQPPEQKNMYLYIVAVLDIYLHKPQERRNLHSVKVTEFL